MEISNFETNIQAPLGIVNLKEDDKDVVLEQKHAVDWVYRGEGAANLVLAYTGSSHSFVRSYLLPIPQLFFP